MEENATDLSVSVDPFFGDPDMYVSLEDPEGLSLPTPKNFTWQGLSFGKDTLHMQVRSGSGGERRMHAWVAEVGGSQKTFSAPFSPFFFLVVRHALFTMQARHRGVNKHAWAR